MDDDETAATTERSKMAPYLPPGIVWEIMVRLPVNSLLRFRCVCKAWRDRISDDAGFHAAHLRVQAPSLLAWIRTKENEANKVATISLYASGEESALNLEDTMELPLEDDAHYFMSCDALVLMPTETVVRVLNPATRRILTLPGSSNSAAQALRFYKSFLTHQRFGIGRDPRSNTYKVVRFFFGSMDPVPTGGYHHNFGMEVFTIGVDQHWRETTVQLPYPAYILGNTTYYKGSLFWSIDENKLSEEESVPGFLRFRLDDESFSVMQPPPRCRRLIYAMSYMAEMRGELSVAHASPGPNYESIEIWTCNNVDTNPPRWNQRYSFKNFNIPTDPFFKAHMYYDCQHLLLRQVFKDIVGVNARVMNHRLDSIIFYIPSLVPL